MGMGSVIITNHYVLGKIERLTSGTKGPTICGSYLEGGDTRD